MTKRNLTVAEVEEKGIVNFPFDTLEIWYWLAFELDTQYRSVYEPSEFSLWLTKEKGWLECDDDPDTWYKKPK